MEEDTCLTAYRSFSQAPLCINKINSALEVQPVPYNAETSKAHVVSYVENCASFRKTYIRMQQFANSGITVAEIGVSAYYHMDSNEVPKRRIRICRRIGDSFQCMGSGAESAEYVWKLIDTVPSTYLEAEAFAQYCILGACLEDPHSAGFVNSDGIILAIQHISCWIA